MAWYLQLLIYVLSCSGSLFALWQVDFNKFMRVNHKQFAVLVYIILSLAVGAAIGFMLVSIGNAIASGFN